MQPSWARSHEPSSLGGGDQQLTRGLSQAWSQLGKARKELRRMEHRLEDAHTAIESGAAGSNPSSSVTGHAAYHVNAHSLPTARFVDATSPSRGSSKTSTSKRKVSRLDDKDHHRTAPSASSSPLVRQQQRHHRERPRRAWSPIEAAEVGGASSSTAALPNAKRVDFSQRLRLREVERDGTYRDTAYHHNHNHLQSRHGSDRDPYNPDLDFDLPLTDRDRDLIPHPLTYPYPSATSLTHSDLDPHPHHSYPYSQPEDGSTLTDSRAVRETEIRFLNDTFARQPLRRQQRDLDDHDHDLPHHHHHHHHHPSERRSRQPRLTRVDVDLPGGRPGSRSSKDRVQGHAERPAGGGRSSSSSTAVTTTAGSLSTTNNNHRESGPGGVGRAGHGDYGARGAVLLPAGAGREMSTAASKAGGGGVGGGDMGDSSGGSGDLVAGAVGGAEEGSSTRGVSARMQKMQKIKKTLKELPQDDNILNQLREKIRQQRLSASSADTSQNDSLASSVPTSETSRDVTPLHTLHDAQEPVRLGDYGFVEPEKMPLSRKVAAGPPVPTYRGFSEVHLDPQVQATVKQVNRLTASRRRTGASHKAADPVQNAIQAQIRAQHPAAASSSVVPASTSTPNSKSGDRKVYRVIAHGKKPPKPGAKNLITTSSWRAGQELIARELGLPKPRSKDELKKGGSSEQGWPDGTEGNTASGGRPHAEGATASVHLAQSKALSDDAKKLYSDLQLDNKDRISTRPAVKRKAPKEPLSPVEKEVEKADPAEKQRHYDAESVRQFMAKQKAQRQRQRDEARKAEELEQQKRQKLMKELITKQKSAVATTSVSKPKKVKRAGKGKQKILFPADHEAFDQRIRALLGGDAENPDQRAMEVDEDDNSEDTLTGDSQGSTPRATPLHIRDENLRGPSANYNNNIRPHHGDHRLDTTITTSIATNTAATAAPAVSSGQSGSTINFQGNVLNLDVNSVLARFSQVVSQHQAGGGSLPSAAVGGNEERVSGGTGTERSRQDRLQGLKTSAKTLQSKIVTASAEIHHAQKESHTEEEADDSSSEAEFVPRYDRIAGSHDSFNVFTSNLPGAQNVVARATSNSEKTPAAAGRTVSTSQRDSISAAFPRAAALTVAGNDQGAEDDDSVTETSTFSEVTAADDWEAETPKRKAEVARSNAAPQATDTGSFSAMQYRAPAGTLAWEKPRSDPYSALNVFSRQQRYGIRGPGRPDRQSSNRGSVADGFSQSESTRLKEPRVTSSQQVVFGQTPEGHPTMMRTTYTRMEATLQDRSHAPQPSMSARNRASRSEDRGGRIHQSSYASRNRSTSEDTLESEEEATPKAASSRQASKKSAIDYQRQTSDTGQESDVSQLSEDEPRHSHRTYDRPIVDTSQEEVGDTRWSPAALERQMAAELARLESLEDSIRQLSSAERTRAVALAQQETVSVAQVLKARQQEHTAELRSLQLQVQEERLATAHQLQQHVSMGVQAPASDMSSLSPDRRSRHAGGNAQLIEQAENRRPETKATTATSVSRSRGRDDTEYSETFTTTRVSKSVSSVSPSRSAASRTPTTRTSSSVRTAQDSAASVRTAEDSTTESLKTAEDSHADSEASIKTASDTDHHSPDVSAAPEEVPDGDYSLSFEESMTEDESFKQAEGNRRDARRQKNNKPPTEDVSSYRLNDLTSASFNHLSTDIIRNILREEEMRATHQESLLRIRMKALKEKTRTQLSLLEQERQAVKTKGSEETRERDLKRLAEKEKTILREQAESQADIDRLIKTEKLAKEHRQSLSKQHEEIAKMQKKTREKMQKLQGPLDGVEEVHTEDETSVIEDLSDVSDVSYAKDSKSDTEVTQRKAKVRGDKQKMEKQQKLRLDQKYLTVREQQLMERKKNANELLHWKKMLDAEEKKVIQMERTALKAWDDYEAPGAVGDKKRDGKREDAQSKVTAPGNLRPEPTGARSADPVTPRTALSESAVTPRTAISESAVTPRTARTESAVDSYTPISQSEAVSTHISASETDRKQSATESSTSRSRAARTRSSAASESSVTEDIPDGGSEATRHSAAASPETHHHHDSSDDTIINSSVNEEEDVESSRHKGKKSPVGRLLSPKMAKPLPQLWSQKTGGSESESEESMSHTETLSDVSDYEVRIRQLNDMLRRRRKEAESLKKERSKRQKEKLRAQEESLKKQVEAYETYIAQVKNEQADLKREGNKPTVPPKIKQPHASKTKTSPSASPSPGRRNQRDEANYSSSFEGTDSNQTSPALSEGKDSRVSPLAEKGKQKQTVSSSSTTIMDRISEASESQSSDRSQKDGKVKGHTDNKTSPAHSVSEGGSLSEAIEEAADTASTSERSRSAPLMNIKTSVPSKADEENLSYTEDFSNTASASKSLAKSNSKIPVSIRSETSQASVRTALKSEASVSEAIESAVSTAKSDSTSAPKLDLVKTTPAVSSPAAAKDTNSGASSRPATGIQESDSESESRINSHRTLSRPSSERSTGSTTYSDLHDFDEVGDEDEDIISSGSDRTPVKVSVSHKEKERSVAHSVRSEEDISEHISMSLPSISEKKSASQATALGRQESIDAALGDLLGEEDATPTQTPRAESPLEEKETLDPLLMTDPLADFHTGDAVLVAGHLKGTLRFKGPVSFAPGFWAGVELDTPQGDTDGQHDGKTYFTCRPDYGMLVPGSEISALEEEEGGEEGEAGKAEEEELVVKSPDESLTDQDEVSSATEGDKSEPSPRIKPARPYVATKEEEEALTATASPLHKTADTPAGRQNLDLLADTITADLTRSLMEDSVVTMNSIASRQSPPQKSPPPTQKTPPPTLPKPKMSPDTSPPTTPKNKESSPPPTLPKPKISFEQQQEIQQEKSEEMKREAQQRKVDSTTSSVVGGLLDDAISKMMQIRRGRLDSAENQDVPLVNGYSDNDSGVVPSHDNSLEKNVGISPEPELVDADGKDLNRPISPQRPKSPVPVINSPSEAEQDDDYDFTGLMGDDQDFFEDDFGLSAKPPPPYPGSGDQSRGGRTGSPVPAAKSSPSTNLFIIPHTRTEVDAIVADAVEVYWNLRRCGEPWEAATPPPEYMAEHGTTPDGAAAGEQMEGMVSGSRRTFKQLVFDLTGEIVRDIYAHENNVEPPAWQKPSPRRHRYFKQATPPTTMDDLLPLVQSSVTDIFGLNGCSGRHRGQSTNKWNVRKKKDHVDAVLVEELREEEADWVNYDSDELAVKMQLTETIFESLLADTVATLNTVYAKRQRRLQAS